jgi:hypothetical protein
MALLAHRFAPALGSTAAGRRTSSVCVQLPAARVLSVLLRCDDAPFSTLHINHAVIADMYQSIANETNNEISEFSSSIDLLQGPLQTAADGIRTTADMLSKSVILYVACARPVLDDGMAVLTLFMGTFESFLLFSKSVFELVARRT